jgi:lipopolysaccharide transport system permease protein
LQFSIQRHLLLQLWRSRALVARLVIQDLYEAVAGSVLGIAWLVFVPLSTMAIYIFVFGFVFKSRIGQDGSAFTYSAFLLSGMIPWLLTLDVANRGSSAIISRIGLVKEVVFPAEILPLQSALTSMATYTPVYALFILFAIVVHRGVPATFLLLPILFSIHVIFMVGLSFTLAALTPFLRDIPRIVALAGSIVIYVAPIVYVKDNVPAVFQPLLYLNPLSYMVWCYQDALFFGSIQHVLAWLVFPVLSLVLFFLGFRIFGRLQPIFGNVL